MVFVALPPTFIVIITNRTQIRVIDDLNNALYLVIVFSYKINNHYHVQQLGEEGGRRVQSLLREDRAALSQEPAQSDGGVEVPHLDCHRVDHRLLEAGELPELSEPGEAGLQRRKHQVSSADQPQHQLEERVQRHIFQRLQTLQAIERDEWPRKREGKVERKITIEI